MANIKIKDVPSIPPKETYKIPIGNTEYDDARTVSINDLKQWMGDSGNGGSGGWSFNDLTNVPNFVEITDVSTINGQSILTGEDIQVEANTIQWENVVGKPTIPTKTSELENDLGFVTATDAENYLQPKLFSGLNLATVNGYDLLSGGNIVISGGGSSNLNYSTIGSYAPPYIQIIDENQNNVIPLSLKPIKKIDGNNINIQFDDGYLYVFSDGLTDLNFTLNPSANLDFTAEYHFIFTSDQNTPTTIGWDANCRFTNGTYPTIQANTTYEVNIINNCVLIQSYV